MDYGVTGNTTVFGAVIPGSNPGNPTTNLCTKVRIYHMAKGKKYSTPKRHWNKLGKKVKFFHAHVMSSNHKKFKWFFRKKNWFTDENLKKMSMRFPMSHEIWGWD